MGIARRRIDNMTRNFSLNDEDDEINESETPVENNDSLYNKATYVASPKYDGSFDNVCQKNPYTYEFNFGLSSLN